jgi:hypothetical protein
MINLDRQSAIHRGKLEQTLKITHRSSVMECIKTIYNAIRSLSHHLILNLEIGNEYLFPIDSQINLNMRNIQFFPIQ